jgi:hypothetical protein
MPVYLILSRGPRADDAIPILASSDQRIVGAVLQAIARLDDPERATERPSVDCVNMHSDEEDADEPRS